MKIKEYLAKFKNQNIYNYSQYRPLVYHKETIKIFDNWINEYASIGSNNSLSQYNTFLLDRLSYQECAQLSLDTLINKSITTLAYDIISHGYEIILINDSLSSEELNHIKNTLKKRIKDYKLDFLMQELIIVALRFGGGFLFFDIDNNLEFPINNDEECALNRKLHKFIVVEPSGLSAGYVNTTNVLKNDYMKPKKWYVAGSGMLDSTRLLDLTFFEVPKIIKPYFNYLGISLTQLMKDYTQNAETIRQSLAELMLRFKTDYIKTSSENIGDDEYMSRIKFNNATRNNFSTLLLGESEDLQQINTSINGLDNIASQAYELVVASSGIPATRLMGISPRGFNATGESDLQHYYETIAQYQSKVKPLLIECLTKILRFNLKRFDNFFLDIEFNAVNYQTEREKLENINLKADFYGKMLQNGIISEEEALESFKNNDTNFNNIELQDDNEGL